MGRRKLCHFFFFSKNLPNVIASALNTMKLLRLLSVWGTWVWVCYSVCIQVDVLYQYMCKYEYNRIVSNQANRSIFFFSIFAYTFSCSKTPVLATCFFCWVWTDIIKKKVCACLSLPSNFHSHVRHFFSKIMFTLFILTRALQNELASNATKLMEQRKWFNKTVMLIYVKTFFWYDGMVESKCQYGMVHLVIPNIDGIICDVLIWKIWKSQHKQ